MRSDGPGKLLRTFNVEDGERSGTIEDFPSKILYQPYLAFLPEVVRFANFGCCILMFGAFWSI